MRALEKLLTPEQSSAVSKKALLELQAHYLALAGQGCAESETAQNHVNLIAALLKKFGDREKLPCVPLQAATDNYLRAQGYAPTAQMRSPATARRLYPEPEAVCYDLAFYSSLYNHIRRGHHNDGTKSALFYFRAERWGKTLVLGNLQIDAPASCPGKNSPELNIILRRRNIYAGMIHEALKHAVAAGMKRIIFHAGSAAAWAQWQTKIVTEKTLVTPEIYARSRHNYNERCALLAQIPLGIHAMQGLTVHDNPYAKLMPEHYAYDASRALLVYDKKPGQISGQWLYGYNGKAGLNYTLFHYCRTRSRGAERAKYQLGHQKLLGWGEQINAAVIDKNPVKIVSVMDELAQFFQPNFKITHTSVKHKYMAELLEQAQESKGGDLLGWPIFYRWLDHFSERFGYDKIILSACPEIKIIETSRRYFGRKLFYVDPTHGENWHLTPQSFAPPKIGKYAVRAWEVQLNGSRRPLRPGRLAVYDWYEVLVPKMLATAGLKFRKVPLRTLGPGLTVYGWEIIDGLNEFSGRPLRIF